MEKSVSDLTGDVSQSHPSALHAVYGISLGCSDDNMPLTVSRDPTSFGVTSNSGAAPSVAADTMTSQTKWARGMRFTLLTNQPSVLATSNRAAESTPFHPPPKVPLALSVRARVRILV